MKMYVVGIPKNRKPILMSTHNIHFYGDMMHEDVFM